MSLIRPAAGGESCEAEFFIVIKIDLERSLIMKSVLVTAIGSFAADIIIKELKNLSYRVVGCDIYKKELIVDAYNVDEFYTISLAADEKKYLEDILDICKNENIDYILPIIDIEVDVFNAYRYIFDKLGIKLLIADKFCIDTCRDKLKTYEYLLGDESVNLIRGYTKDYIDKQIEDSNFHYSLLVKPLDGRSSEGLRRINNKYDWYAFINSEDTDRYLIQDFIKGNVITADVVRDKYKNSVAVLRKELVRTKNGAGLSVYVYEDEKLEEVVKHIADKLDVLGCVNMEFIQTENNEFYFLECNPRFSGGVEFSNMAGYNMIKNHVNALLDKAIEDFKFDKPMYIARKYEEFITKTEC